MQRAVTAIALGLVLAWIGTTGVVLAGPANAGPNHASPAAAPIAPGEDADEVALAFDDDGVLHLVAHLRTPGRNNHLVHRSQTPGGEWSATRELTPDFAISGGNMELVRHPDGAVCLFFDGWRDARDGATEGLYLTCLRAGAWEPVVQVAGGFGVTATFDGAFAADGRAVGIYARPTRTIGFGELDLWRGDVDAGWPRLVIDGQGTFHAAWGAFTDPFGIFTSRSTDGGASWSPPERLTGDLRAGVPFDLLADANGDVHLLVPGAPSIYRRWSGGRWGDIATVPTDFGQTRLAVGPDGLASIALGAPEGITVFSQRADGGWSDPTILEPLTGAPRRVAVAVDPAGRVAVLWADADGLFAGGASGGGGEGFAGSVPSPFDITLDPVIVAQSAALAAGVVLLIPLPAQLFNNTIEANYARISAAGARLRRRLGRGRPGLAGFWRRPLGIVTFFVLAAVISAFLDPTLAPDLDGAATLVGLLAGLVTVALGFAVPSVVLHRVRSRGQARIDVLPLALPVAVVSVVISRVTGFEPGYLYGLLAGVTLVGSVRPGDDARSVKLSSLWVLGLVLVAWFALVLVREATGGASRPLWAVATEAGLAKIVVSGLEGLLFGLLPMKIAPGGILYRANRRAWVILLGVSAFAFFHVLVNPTSGYLVDSSRVPVVTTVALFVGFSALTALTWAYFRLRPTRLADPPPP